MHSKKMHLLHVLKCWSCRNWSGQVGTWYEWIFRKKYFHKFLVVVLCLVIQLVWYNWQRFCYLTIYNLVYALSQMSKLFIFRFNSRPKILLFIVTVIFYPLNNIIENENFNIEFLFKGFFKVEYFHEHFNSHVYCWNFLVFNKYLWFNKNLSKCKVLS